MGVTILSGNANRTVRTAPDLHPLLVAGSQKANRQPVVTTQHSVGRKLVVGQRLVAAQATDLFKAPPFSID